MNYTLHLLIYFDIYLIVALSLNLVVGYCGRLTLAHAGYYAIGAYACTILTMKASWGFLPACLAAAGIAAVLSLAVSLPAWRLRGDFFVLVSLAVQVLIYSLLYNWFEAGKPFGTWKNLANGPFGITGIPRPTALGVKVDSLPNYVVFSTIVASVCAGLLWRWQRSPWGRLLVAMRDDELAARGLGKDTRLATVQAFAISCGIVAIAGALYAGHIRYLDPTTASLDESVLMLSMVLVGGLGNFRGPIIGAALLIAIPEALRFLPISDSIAANMRLLIYGLLLVLMMRFRPQGILGEYRME